MLTIDGLVTRFGEAEIIELSDHNGVGAIDTAVVQTAINDATKHCLAYIHMIDNALDYPEVIANLADVARFRLYEDSADGIVKYRYEQAMKWFEDVAKNPSMLTKNLTDDPSCNQSAIVPIMR